MKTAWVLCGGGSRGAYEIGVWQALSAAGLAPDIVTGTSIGALNGALIVQQDYAAALDLWANLRIEDVMQDGFDLELSAIMENKQKIAPFLKKIHQHQRGGQHAVKRNDRPAGRRREAAPLAD